MPSDPIVIAAAARTPMGGFLGALKPLPAPQLGAAAIRAAVERAGVAPDEVDEVIMGNVLPAGQGQAPARQASLAAGLPESTGCTTINKVCGSGMKAAMLAHDLIALGTNRIMVTGGMESMSNAPYLLPKARGGLRLGHAEVKDHMFLDGLEDAYDPGRLMGTYAETTAAKYGYTREAQDRYAITSLTRAQDAIRSGRFRREIVPVTAGGSVVADDEQPLKANPDRIPQLKPAFSKDGTVTAANSSSISDGGAAMVLMTLSEAERRGHHAARAYRRPRHALTGAGVVYDGADRRDPQAFREDRLGREIHRSLRDQRSVRGRGDGGDRRARAHARARERARRRVRAGSSARRFRRAHHGDAARRARASWIETRHRGAVHRRRRSDGDRAGAVSDQPGMHFWF